MEEMLNVLDEEGQIIGTASRKEIHQEGLLHAEVHVWFYTSDGKIIFQHRSKDKDTCPDLLDATAGGHVEIGDSYEDSALKEVEEETGLTLTVDKLVYLTTIRRKSNEDVSGKINNVLRATYAYRFDGDIKDLHIEENKSQGFESWSVDTILNIDDDNRKRFIGQFFVPEYLEVFRKIKELKSEPIKIPNSKGQNIATVIHRPTGKTEKLAILCPGYLDTKGYMHLIALADDLAGKGYTAVRFDPTGTWESEGDISEYLTSQYLKDIESILEHMLAEGAYTYVLLGGHSRGGQVSILYAARDPRISEVLGIMPSHAPVEGKRREDWEKAGVSNSSRDIPGNTEERKPFSVPFQHVLDRDQFDALGDIQKIIVPIVLVFAEFDVSVPPEHVQELFAHANEPKTLIFLEGMDHEYRHNPEEIKKVNALIMDALQP